MDNFPFQNPEGLQAHPIPGDQLFEAVNGHPLDDAGLFDNLQAHALPEGPPPLGPLAGPLVAPLAPAAGLPVPMAPHQAIALGVVVHNAQLQVQQVPSADSSLDDEIGLPPEPAPQAAPEPAPQAAPEPAPQAAAQTERAMVLYTGRPQRNQPRFVLTLPVPTGVPREVYAGPVQNSVSGVPLMGTPAAEGNPRSLRLSGDSVQAFLSMMRNSRRPAQSGAGPSSLAQGVNQGAAERVPEQNPQGIPAAAVPGGQGVAALGAALANDIQPANQDQVANDIQPANQDQVANDVQPANQDQVANDVQPANQLGLLNNGGVVNHAEGLYEQAPPENQAAPVGPNPWWRNNWFLGITTSSLALAFVLIGRVSGAGFLFRKPTRRSEEDAKPPKTD